MASSKITFDNITYSSELKLCLAKNISYRAFLLAKKRYPNATSVEVFENLLLDKTIGYVKDHKGNRFKTVSDMCKHYGVCVDTYRKRIRDGYNKQDALEMRNQRLVICKDHNGKIYKSLAEMARAYKVPYERISRSLREGYDIRYALGVWDYPTEIECLVMSVLHRYDIRLSKLARSLGLRYNDFYKSIHRDLFSEQEKEKIKQKLNYIKLTGRI